MPARDGTRTRGADVAATCVLFAVALALRIALARCVPISPAWDGVLYERAARAIALGLGYTTFMFVHRANDTTPTAFYPVGYPAFVGGLYALFGARLAVQRIAGAIVSALTVAVTHRIAHRFVPRWPARLAGLALALLPGQLLFANAAMTEPLFGVLIALAVLVAVRRDASFTITELVALGVVLGIATYVRPQALVLVATLPLLRPGPVGRGTSSRMASAIIVGAVAIACVLPWTVRNCRRLDGCELVSSNGGANFAIGAVPRATGTFFFLGPQDGCVGVVGEVARNRCWRETAMRAIERRPMHWLGLVPFKLGHTLGYETYPASYLREAMRENPSLVGETWHPLEQWLPIDAAHEHILARVLTHPWRVLLALALFALVPFGRRAPLPLAARGALLALATLLATHAVIFGGDRYHLPLVALVCVVAAGAFRGLAPVRAVHESYRLSHTRTHDATNDA